ncbi:MAG TPA: hypothetical protein VGO89_09190 [Streptomyces sp.]|nr:hypothetical protein [Streptomyces sp.]
MRHRSLAPPLPRLSRRRAAALAAARTAAGVLMLAAVSGCMTVNGAGSDGSPDGSTASAGAAAPEGGVSEGGGRDGKPGDSYKSNDAKEKGNSRRAHKHGDGKRGTKGPEGRFREILEVVEGQVLASPPGAAPGHARSPRAAAHFASSPACSARAECAEAHSDPPGHPDDATHPTHQRIGRDGGPGSRSDPHLRSAPRGAYAG